MTQFEEAMSELNIPDDAPPRRKARAVYQWILGDPDWADLAIEWLRDAGYEVRAIQQRGE